MKTRFQNRRRTILELLVKEVEQEHIDDDSSVNEDSTIDTTSVDFIEISTWDLPSSPSTTKRKIKLKRTPITFDNNNHNYAGHIMETSSKTNNVSEVQITSLENSPNDTNDMIHATASTIDNPDQTPKYSSYLTQQRKNSGIESPVITRKLSETVRKGYTKTDENKNCKNNKNSMLPCKTILYDTNNITNNIPQEREKDKQSDVNLTGTNEFSVDNTNFELENIQMLVTKENNVENLVNDNAELNTKQRVENLKPVLRKSNRNIVMKNEDVTQELLKEKQSDVNLTGTNEFSVDNTNFELENIQMLLTKENNVENLVNDNAELNITQNFENQKHNLRKRSNRNIVVKIKDVTQELKEKQSDLKLTGTDEFSIDNTNFELVKDVQMIVTKENNVKNLVDDNTELNIKQRVENQKPVLRKSNRNIVMKNEDVTQEQLIEKQCDLKLSGTNEFSIDNTNFELENIQMLATKENNVENLVNDNTELNTKQRVENQKPVLRKSNRNIVMKSEDFAQEQLIEKQCDLKPTATNEFPVDNTNFELVKDIQMIVIKENNVKNLVNDNAELNTMKRVDNQKHNLRKRSNRNIVVKNKDFTQELKEKQSDLILTGTDEFPIDNTNFKLLKDVQMSITKENNVKNLVNENAELNTTQNIENQKHNLRKRSNRNIVVKNEDVTQELKEKQSDLKLIGTDEFPLDNTNTIQSIEIQKPNLRKRNNSNTRGQKKKLSKNMPDTSKSSSKGKNVKQQNQEIEISLNLIKQNTRYEKRTKNKNIQEIQFEKCDKDLAITGNPKRGLKRKCSTTEKHGNITDCTLLQTETKNMEVKPTILSQTCTTVGTVQHFSKHSSSSISSSIITQNAVDNLGNLEILNQICMIENHILKLGQTKQDLLNQLTTNLQTANETDNITIKEENNNTKELSQKIKKLQQKRRRMKKCYNTNNDFF